MLTNVLSPTPPFPELARRILRMPPNARIENNRVATLIAAIQAALADTDEPAKKGKREVTDWRDVRRQRPVHILGDSNGSYQGFIASLLSLGLIEVRGQLINWIGGMLPSF